LPLEVPNGLDLRDLQSLTGNVEGSLDGRKASIRSQRQGLAMAPVEYFVALPLVEEEAEIRCGLEVMSEEEDLSTSPSMPDLRELENSEGQQSYAHEYYSRDSSLNYYGELSGEEVFLDLLDRMGGDTVASTSSFLSDLEISSVRSQLAQQRTSYIMEIPVRELDDSPDDGLFDAALLEARSRNSFGKN